MSIKLYDYENNTIATDTPVEEPSSGIKLFDYSQLDTPAPVATSVAPVKPTFKTFSELSNVNKAKLGVAKVTKGWYGGSLGAVSGLIESISTGKDFLKGAFTGSTVAEELAKDTTFDTAVKNLANIYSTQAEINQDELRATKASLGVNPDDTFVDQLFQGTGYLTNFIATGVPTKVAAVAVGFGKYAGAIANTLNVASESLMEAQDVYKEAKANGKSDKEAYEATRNTLASNALLIGLTNKFSGVFEDTAFKGIKRMMKVGASGLVEGVQEAAQTMVSNYNTDKPLLLGVKDSFLIGAALGVPMAVAFDTGTKQGKEEAQKIIEESTATPEQKQLATDILDGVATEEQKQQAVLDATTNETFNIPVNETNKGALQEDIQGMIEQGANVGDIVIALQEEGISQNDAENLVAEVMATPEPVVTPVVEAKVEVSPVGKTKEQIMEDTTVPEARKKAMSEVDFYLDSAEAGKRIFVPESTSSDYNVVAVSSSFPQWIPENMRSRKVFDQLKPYWEKQERPSKRTPRLQALYDKFQDHVNEMEKQYQKDIDTRMTMKQDDTGAEFKTRKETATREVKVLEDFKKRYKVDFPVVIVDKIIQGQKTKLSADRTALAEGVTDGNTIAIAFDAVVNTAKHELVHLTLNNLDQIPELARFTREDILKAQAEKMGEKFTENKAKDIEEQLALDFETYQNKEYKPNNSILAKFFASIDKMIKNFRSVIVKSNGDVITQYYDAILYGETARKEEVAIATESSVTKYLIDGVLDYTPMYQTRRVLSLSNGIKSVDFKTTENVFFEEALKYDDANSFVNSFEKRYHQTSPEIESKIQKEGFKLGEMGSGHSDVLPVGINTKIGDLEIGIRARGSQIESYFPKNTNIRTFESRDEAEKYFYWNIPEYKDAIDEVRKIDNESKKTLDAMEKKSDELAKTNPGREVMMAEYNKHKEFINEWSKKDLVYLNKAREATTKHAEFLGWEVLQINKDTGGFGRITDNTIILNPKLLKTKAQLTDIWNKAQEAKSQPKFKEALDKSLEVYKESGDLTTKILKDLEGKTTVSKQYILDATNRGDVKQIEKNIIRDMLFFEGDKVNVKDFAFKVQQELLPLFVKSSDNIVPNEDKDYNPFTMNDEGSFTPKYEFVNLPTDLRGDVEGYVENIYESPIPTVAGKHHFNYQTNNYFGHTRAEDVPNNVRRVIEVQSDLYQRNRMEEESRQAKEMLANPTYQPENKKNFTNPEAFDMIVGEAKNRLRDVAKLEQYNDPTAHFRMIREEIRSATQDGKSVLQFPTGETAMKIEGLGDRTTWRNSDGYVIKPEELKVGETVMQGEGDFEGGADWIITDVLGDGKFKAVSKDQLNEGTLKDLKNGIIDSRTKSLSEEFDISGKVDTNNPIYKFYEKEVGRYLKNNYKAETVTDDKGVTWYEVKLKDEYKGAVVAFKERVSRADNEEYIKKTYPKYYEAIRAKLPPKKASRAFERAKARLQEEYQFDTTYTTVKIANEMAKAMEVVAQNPEYAKQVALGVAEAPVDVTDTAISLAVAEQAKESKDYKLQADAEKERSLRQTRRGQEIVMEKGRVDENSSGYFIKQVLERRKELIAQKYKPFMKKGKSFIELVDEVKENKMKKNKKIKSELDLKIEDFDSFLMEIAC